LAIAKKPGSNTRAPDDAAADRFIAKAGAGKTEAMMADLEEKGMKPVMIRMESDLRDRIDRAAKAVGLGRSAWLRLKAIKALEEEGR
jgi:hypothetical protein